MLSGSAPDDITRAHIATWVGHLPDTGAPANANWLLDEGEIEHHPTTRMNRPFIPDTVLDASVRRGSSPYTGRKSCTRWPVGDRRPAARMA